MAMSELHGALNSFAAKFSARAGRGTPPSEAELDTTVKVALLSVPHWFDARIAVAIGGEVGVSNLFDAVEELVDGGFARDWDKAAFAVVGSIRDHVLDEMARWDPALYQALSAMYDRAFASDVTPSAHVERLYHRLGSQATDDGCRAFLDSAIILRSDPFFATETVSRLAKLAREQSERGVGGRRLRDYLIVVESLLPTHGKGAEPQVTDLLALLEPGYGPRFEAEVLLRAGLKLLQAAATEAAIAELTRAAELFGSLGDPRGQGESLRALARAFARADRVAEARAAYVGALSNFDETHRRTSAAHCIRGLAELDFHEGNYDAAVVGFAEALVRFEGTNSRFGEANTRVTFAQLDIRKGNIQEARANLSTALSIYASTGDAIGRGNCLKGEGQAHFELAEFEEALECFEAAQREYKVADASAGIANSKLLIGACLTRLGRPEEALTAIRNAFETFVVSDDKVAKAMALREEGLALEAKGDLMTAFERLTDCVAMFRQLHDPVEEAISEVTLGLFADRNDSYGLLDRDTVRSRVHDAERLLARVGIPKWVNRATELVKRLSGPHEEGPQSISSV